METQNFAGLLSLLYDWSDTQIYYEYKVIYLNV